MTEQSSIRPRALGSKSRSFIPMAPRSVKHNFTQQAIPQTSHSADGQPPKKRLKPSSAPKGSKLASGYTDRAAQLRAQEAEEAKEEDDKQRRLKDLEGLLKKEEITLEVFEREREELGIGGDLSSTHLVKGLDFRLLERVRRGEDVAQATTETTEVDEAGHGAIADQEEDVEDELQKALSSNVIAPQKGRQQQEDEREHEQALSGAAEPQVSLSRDEILRRYRRSRAGQPSSPEPAPEEPSLDQSKFRKLDPGPKKSKHKFTETINGRRREVLVITQKDGSTKRKTRWLDPETDPATIRKSKKADGATGEIGDAWGGDLDAGVLARQKSAAEEAIRQKEKEDEDDDGDIFGDVAEYDPLAGIDSDEEVAPNGNQSTRERLSTELPASDPQIDQEDIRSKPLKSTGKRNYFSTAIDAEEEEGKSSNPKHDPSIIAALKRAAQIRRQEGEDGDESDAELANNDSKGDGSDAGRGDRQRNEALLKKLQQRSGQDDIDLDMGFGEIGRFDDEDDDDGRKQKLSEWKGVGHDNHDDEADTATANDKAKRKRGGKKKKGDKNSYADVMSVIEGRKK